MTNSISENDSGVSEAIEKKQGYSCWVVFIVSAPDMHPELITQLLDMEPDRSVNPDSLQEGEWQINSRLSADQDLNTHIRHLLAMLMPLRGKLRQIRTDAKLEMYCAIKPRQTEVLLIEIEPRLQLLCGHLGIELRLELDTEQSGL